MRVCRHCGQTFYPVQTFQTLFNPQTACKGCLALLKTPLRSEHLPLDRNTLILLTHDHPPHPALVDALIEAMWRTGATVLFHESIKRADTIATALIATLLKPLVLYHPDYPTLDVLEHLLKRFDSELKISHVSLESSS